MNEEGALLKKIFAGLGLILLVAGGVLFLFPVEERYLETVTKRKWDLQSQTIAPQDTTFYGSYLGPNMYFQLNISSPEGAIKVIVSIVRHLPDLLKETVWEGTGTYFDQMLSSGGTSYIDIYNENLFPVTLQGNVLVLEKKENYRTVYPYVIQGFLIMLVGISALIFGILKKPKGPLKSKSTRGKKNKS